MQAVKRIRSRALTPAASFGVGAVLLPDRWVAAAEAAMMNGGSSQAQIFDDALKFHRFWANRDMPDMELPKASPVRGRVFASEDGVKYKNSLRYGEREALAYLVSQGPHTYASARRVLNELRIRDPAFKPTSVLDFGAGTGSSTWAVHDTWGDDIESITCVDTSLPMLNLAQHMLSEMEYSRHKRFQQFLSPKGEHDLVVASHTLGELPSGDARHAALTSLWNKTTSYLVLVESGSAWGHMCMLEARSHIAALALQDNHHFLQEIHGSDEEEKGVLGRSGADNGEGHALGFTTEAVGVADGNEQVGAEEATAWAHAADHHPYTAHVVAPCPHMRTCPLTKTSRPCHFPSSVVWPPSLMYHEAFRRRQARRVKFAYMVLKKQKHEDLTAYSQHVLQCASAYASSSSSAAPGADGQQQEDEAEDDDTLAAIAAHAGTTALHQHTIASPASQATPGEAASGTAATPAATGPRDVRGEIATADHGVASSSNPLRAYKCMDGPIVLTHQDQDTSTSGREQCHGQQLDEQQRDEQADGGSNATAASNGNTRISVTTLADTPNNKQDSVVGTHLHRVIRPPKRKKGLVTLQTCAPDGKIRDVVVSKRRVKNDSRWRGAKKLSWGDVLGFVERVSNKPL